MSFLHNKVNAWITGHRGFLGKELVKNLKKEFEIIKISRNDLIESNKYFTKKIPLDLIKKNNLKKFKNNILFHLATLYNPDPKSNEEISQMHAINQANSPDVRDIPNVNQFKSLIDLSETIYAYKDKGIIVGFILLMREGTTYQSENYKFISSKFDQFLYVDRIAIDSKYRRQGLAEKIYSKVISDGNLLGLDVLCEVNTRPKNEISLSFHKKMRFNEIGTQDFEKNSVVYLKRSTK